MRFVAGRGAVAELLVGALQRRAIGKKLLAGRTAVAKMLQAGAPWRELLVRAASGSSWPGAVAKKLATPWRRAIGKKLLTRCAAVAKMLAGRGAECQVPYSAEAPRTEGFPAEVQLLKPPASSITL